MLPNVAICMSVHPSDFAASCSAKSAVMKDHVAPSSKRMVVDMGWRLDLRLTLGTAVLSNTLRLYSCAISSVDNKCTCTVPEGVAGCLVVSGLFFLTFFLQPVVHRVEWCYHLRYWMRYLRYF